MTKAFSGYTTNHAIEGVLRRIKGNPKSMRARIDAKCIECIFEPSAPGTWRMQVESCTVQSCPLWDMRPTSALKSIEDCAD